MKKIMTKLFGFALCLGLLLSACSSTNLSLVYTDEAYNEGPLSDILIIGVTQEKGVRRSFETKFVTELTAVGVEAVSSFDILHIPEDKKLEKEDILRVIQEQGNDAVIITRLIGVEKDQVLEPSTPARVPFYAGYTMAYSHAYGGVYRTQTFVHLETNLYSAKTEKLIWSGKSETWDPKTDASVIDEVIKAVIKDMTERGLLKAK